MPLFGPPDIEKLKEKRDVNALIRALNHRDAAVRSRAAKGLGGLGDAQAVMSLIGALQDSHWLVVENAARALGEIGDEWAIGPLAELVDRPWRSSGIGQALETIGYTVPKGGGFSAATESAKAQLEAKDIRKAARDALKSIRKRIGGPEAERALAEHRAQQK